MQHSENSPPRQFAPAAPYPISVPGMVLDICAPQSQWNSANSTLSSHAATPSGIYPQLNHSPSQADAGDILQHGLERNPVPPKPYERRNKSIESNVEFSIDTMPSNSGAVFPEMPQGQPLNNSYNFASEWVAQSHSPSHLPRNELMVRDQRPQYAGLLSEGSRQTFPVKVERDNFTYGMYGSLPQRVSDQPLARARGEAGSGTPDSHPTSYVLDHFSSPYSSQTVSRPSSATAGLHYPQQNSMSRAAPTFQIASTSRAALSSPPARSAIANFASKLTAGDRSPSLKHISLGQSTSSLVGAISHTSSDKAPQKELPAPRAASDSKSVIVSTLRGTSSSHARDSADDGDNARRSSTRKAKMHECDICHKQFPRPSGLKTHMNSHSGAKPYKCEVPTCDKSFAVRSNARRHLRTHGIYSSSDPRIPGSGATQFNVGFHVPQVTDVPDLTQQPQQLRWVPQNLTTRDNEHPRKTPSPNSEVGDSGLEQDGQCFSVSFSSEDTSRQSSADDELYEQNAYLDGDDQIQVMRSLEHPSSSRPT